MKILIAICAAFIAVNSYAQLSIGVGAGILTPIAKNAETHLGGELNVKYKISESIRFGANAGYYQKTQTISSTSVKSSSFPASVMVEYLFLNGDIKPYAGIHLGMISRSINVGNTISTSGNFNLAPTVGLDFSIGKSLFLNLNAKYGFLLVDDEFGKIKVEDYLSPNIGVAYLF